MKNEDVNPDMELEILKQSLLGVTQMKNNKQKRQYNFKQMLQQKLASKESNNEIDSLETSEFLKLLCHQKKCLSKKRAQKVFNLNESKQIEQEDNKYLFMVVTQANYFKLQYPNYYQRLLQQTPHYPKNMFSGIEKDIPRTLMPNHPFHSALHNVLIAYAIRNPNLLYCQGMNYVVAYLLINNISEEQAFWILVLIVQNILPDDFYKDLTTISIVTQIFSDMLPYYFPDLARQMKLIGMDSSLFAVSWYVCLFTKGFINSVSAYLFNRLVLDSREHSFGYCLLKLSLGIIATILGRNQPFSFQSDFTSFRDKLQINVFQISLLQIKLGVDYIELNEENYLKLQKYYKDRRQKKHLVNLQKDLLNKKFSLPICNSKYPICLHRVQIKRKIGQIEEVYIKKNGYSIKSQYIEDYFKGELNKTSVSNNYSSIQDCLMLRQNHICEQIDSVMPDSILNLQKKIVNIIPLRNDQSFMLSHKKINSDSEQDSIHSMEVKSRISRMDSKYIQLSGFFVVNEQFNFSPQEELPQFQNEQYYNQKTEPESGQQKEYQIFNLDEELKIHEVEQDWIKNQNQYHSQPVLQSQAQAMKEKKIQKSNLTQKSIIQKKQIRLQSWAYQFFNKQNLWNILGRTWKKVLKVKQDEFK